MESQVDKWSYNRPNNESWNKGLFDTKEEVEKEAIEYAKENNLEEVEIGMCDLLPLPCHVDPDGILEDLQEQYANEAGGEYDSYDLYDNVKEEDKKWLEDEISKIIHSFNERAGIVSDWYTISKIYGLKIKK